MIFRIRRAILMGGNGQRVITLLTVRKDSSLPSTEDDIREGSRRDLPPC